MTDGKPVFVVAVEYCGADVPQRAGRPRRALREHAYDARAGALAAHDGHPPRVAFPDRPRGWTSEPAAPRCRDCTREVDLVIAALIAEHLRTFLAYAPP